MNEESPIVVLLTIALTALSRRIPNDRARAIVIRATPLFALLVAVAVAASIDAVRGRELSSGTVVAALQAGANAVFAHTATRSLFKKASEE